MSCPLPKHGRWAAGEAYPLGRSTETAQKFGQCWSDLRASRYGCRARSWKGVAAEGLDSAPTNPTPVPRASFIPFLLFPGTLEIGVKTTTGLTPALLALALHRQCSHTIFQHSCPSLSLVLRGCYLPLPCCKASIRYVFSVSSSEHITHLIVSPDSVIWWLSTLQMRTPAPCEV